MTWKSDGIGGVLFTLPTGPQLDAMDAWKIVMDGENPESYQRPSSFPAPASQAEGAFGEYHLGINCTVGRIDIRLSPQPPAQIPDYPLQIADTRVAIELISSLMLKLCGHIRTTRVAVVLNLSKFMDTHSQTIIEFAKIAGINIFPSDSSDNFLQYNLRKSYECMPNIRMNRVTTWSSGEVQFLSAELNFGDTSQKLVPVRTIPIFSWKIDINSFTSQDISSYAEAMIEENKTEASRIIEAGRV